MESKNINNIIAVLAVVVVVVAVINLSTTFLKVSEFEEELIGYASLGYVNISVSSSISINLTNSAADFGAGGVNSTCIKAMLKTNGLTPGVVLCGNWSSDSGKGIVIENNGNVNVTLTALGTKNAATFIGGTDPAYEWNFSLSEDGSCSGGDLTQNVFNTANTSAAATLCTDFSPLDASDEVTIDINITVPYDSTIGALSDTITITASTQG